MAHYYISPSGNDSGTGTKVDPWQTLAQANAQATDGDVIYMDYGVYSGQPNKSNVTYIGATATGGGVKVPARTILSAKGTTCIGIDFEGGVEVRGAAYENVLRNCRIQFDFSMLGEKTVAPYGNRFIGCLFAVRSFYAHNWGDDRDTTVPRITANHFYSCEIRVTRAVGQAGVLWRWSGVTGSEIAGCNIVLVQPDAVGGNDDSASLKWLYCDNNRLVDNVFTFQNSGTNGFAPFWMWRDKTSQNAVQRCSFRVIGSLWFSPNTAGTWVCSCDGNQFVECEWLTSGDLTFYQCPPNVHDKFTRCRIYCDGHFDRYGMAVLPPGLVVISGR